METISAHSLGFDLVGITTTDPLREDESRLATWLASGISSSDGRAARASERVSTGPRRERGQVLRGHRTAIGSRPGPPGRPGMVRKEHAAHFSQTSCSNRTCRPKGPAAAAESASTNARPAPSTRSGFATARSSGRSDRDCGATPPSRSATCAMPGPCRRSSGPSTRSPARARISERRVPPVRLEPPPATSPVLTTAQASGSAH